MKHPTLVMNKFLLQTAKENHAINKLTKEKRKSWLKNYRQLAGNAKWRDIYHEPSNLIKNFIPYLHVYASNELIPPPIITNFSD